MAGSIVLIERKELVKRRSDHFNRIEKPPTYARCSLDVYRPVVS